MWIRIDDADAEKAVAALKAAGLSDLAQRLDEERVAVKGEKRRKLVAAAREQYARGSDDDVEVDDDAPISEADRHAFVGLWGYVTHSEAGLASEDAKEGEP